MARAAVPLALRRGDAAAWAGRTVHFGGPHADATRPPRAALAFAASTPALEDDRDRIEAVRAWATHGHAQVKIKIQRRQPGERRRGAAAERREGGPPHRC